MASTGDGERHDFSWLLREAELLEHDIEIGGVDGPMVVALRRLMDRFDTVFTHAVERFVTSTSFRELGYPNAAAWMSNEARTYASEAESRCRMAATLTRFASLAEALSLGLITPTHVRLLANALTREHLPYASRDEKVLVDAAKAFDPANFAKAVRHWVACCDDERHDPSGADELEAKRSLRLFQLPDGSWRLDGVLTPLVGEALSTVLAAFGPKPSSDDTRTPTQKRHDTLDDIAHDALGRDDRREVGGERPHVTLMINATSGCAVTAAGSVLPEYLRDTVMCDASLMSVYFGPDRKPVIVGLPTKEIPKRARLTVMARDLCCRIPGCGRPARWCDVHHLNGREGPDPHSLDNLALFCRWHHRMIHRFNIRVRFDANGIDLLIEWPNGIVHRSPPPGTVFALT